MSPSVNMHDLAMHVEWNRWSYAIGAAYHNYAYFVVQPRIARDAKISHFLFNNYIGLLQRGLQSTVCFFEVGLQKVCR